MKLKLLIHFILSAGLLVSCTKPVSHYSDSHYSDSENISGGTPVQRRSLLSRSTVLIVQLGENGKSQVGVCSGTLIRADLVLTAAHCLTDLDTRTEWTKPVAVYFGNDPLNDHANRKKFRVKHFVRHPRFVPPIQGSYDSFRAAEVNDVALLQIAGKAPSGFTPVSFVTDQEQLASGTKLTLAGYGPPNMMIDSLIYLRQLDLETTGRWDNNTSQMLLKSGGKNKHSTPGDSGGPVYLIQNGTVKLAAVHSGQSGFDQYPNVAESVPKHLEWIQSVIDQIPPAK